MIGVIENRNATFAGKQFACRMLRLVGTEKSAPALAGLLADEKLSHMARWAMQSMPYASVDAALLEALKDKDLGWQVRAGVINTMGARKDPKAIAELAKNLKGSHAEITQAALLAIGRIGGEEAEKALAGAKVEGQASQTALADARLINADQMLAAGKAAEAKAIYEAMFNGANPTIVRVAGLRGLVRADKEKTIPTLVELMKGQNVKMAAAACKFYNEIPGGDATRALAEALPSLAPQVQVMAATTLMTRGDKSAADAAAKLLASGDVDVKVAAAGAVKVLGGGAQVKALVEAAVAGGPAGDAARDALALINGDGAADEIVKLAEAGDAVARTKAIEAIEARRETKAVPALMKAVQDADRGVKQAAAKALGNVAGDGDIAAMVDMLVAAKENERASLEKALVSVALRAQNKDAAADGIVAKMAGADNGAKGNLMVALAALGSDKGYDAIAGQAKSDDAVLKKAAIRALASWSDAKPAGLLLETAKSDSDAVCKVLALRGYVDVVSQAKELSAGDKVAKLKDAWALAAQVDDKNKILNGVSTVADKAALQMIDPYLTDAEMAMAAQFATIKVAEAMGNKQESIDALQKVIDNAKSDAVKKRAQDVMGKVAKGVKPRAQKAAQKAGQKGQKGQRRQGKKQQPVQPVPAAQ